MIEIRTISEMRKYSRAVHSENKTIGFVPTMGALHKGHLSLIARSVSQNKVTIVSVFVNPIQFNKSADLQTYPRTLDLDISIAAGAGADVMFIPNESVMATGNLQTFVDIEKLDERLCGAKRPGHFRGVCTIVAKLFNIVQPDRAYFGKKDIQQLQIIGRMTRDLDFAVEIIGCPVVREADGLAMSSRNVRLTVDDRRDAVILSRALQEAANLFASGESSASVLQKSIKKTISTRKSAVIDYLEIVDQEIVPVTSVKKGDIIAVAVFFGGVRLIDNLVTGDEICW